RPLEESDTCARQAGQPPATSLLSAKPTPCPRTKPTPSSCILCSPAESAGSRPGPPPPRSPRSSTPTPSAALLKTPRWVVANVQTPRDPPRRFRPGDESVHRNTLFPAIALS